MEARSWGRGRALAAAAVFFVGSAFETGRAIAGGRWGELTHFGSNLGLISAALWLAAAIAIVARRTPSLVLLVVAAGAMLVHAGMLGIATNYLAAFVYLVGWLVVSASILRHIGVLAYGRGERIRRSYT